jgi:hypothetical protein
VAGGPGDSKPPLTLCFAPSGGSAVGALAIGRLEIDPAVNHANVKSDSQKSAQERHAASKILPQPVMPGRGVERAGDTPDRHTSRPPERKGPVILVQSDLSPGKRPAEPTGQELAEQERLRRLRLAEQELVCNLRRKRLLLLPGVDRVICYYPAMGLIVWVHLNDASQLPWLVRITPDAAGQLKIAVIKRTG